MIEINLVPDVKQELLRAQRTRTTVISVAIVASLVAVGVVVLLAIWVYGVQLVRQSVADGQIKQYYNQLSSTKDLSKVLTIQNQLTKISDLNSSKHLNSRIFTVLGAIIPPTPNQVQISDLIVDNSTDTITIQGQAANSYQALEVFKKTIAGTQFSFTNGGSKQTEALASNISTSNVSYGQDSTGSQVLMFTLSFTYTDDLLSPQSTNFTIIPANQANATDSFLGLPQTVFSDKATTTTTTGGSN